MGQYFICVFLAEDGKYIRAFVDPSSYSHGAKLAEHSYVGNSVMNSIEFMLSPSGIFYKSRLVWAGDYANPEISGQDNAEAQGPGPNPYLSIRPAMIRCIRWYILTRNLTTNTS